MRTIKFRAKVFDEPNEWVIGYLVKKGNHYCIFQEYEHEGSKSCGWGVFGIDEETLGEFTGLQDIDGKDIYEGDIVEMYFSESDDNGYILREWTITGEVFYSNYSYGYSVLEKFELDNNEKDYTEYQLIPAVKVIGNIYDNPELLKEV